MKTQHRAARTTSKRSCRQIRVWNDNGYQENGRGLTAMNVSRTVWKLWTLLIVMLALTCLAGAKEVEYAFGPDFITAGRCPQRHGDEAHLE